MNELHRKTCIRQLFFSQNSAIFNVRAVFFQRPGIGHKGSYFYFLGEGTVDESQGKGQDTYK